VTYLLQLGVKNTDGEHSTSEVPEAEADRHEQEQEQEQDKHVQLGVISK